MSNVTGTFYQGDAIHGYGAEWLVGQDDGSPETFVAVADVEKITPGDMNTAIFEKTHLRSPGAHREKKAGLRDSGPFQMMCNWRPDHGSQSNAGGDGFTSGGLLAIWRNREERNMQIKIYDTDGVTVIKTWPFRGVISKFQPGEIGVDGKIPLSVEVTPLSDFSDDL